MHIYINNIYTTWSSSGLCIELIYNIGKWIYVVCIQINNMQWRCDHHKDIYIYRSCKKYGIMKIIYEE